MTPEQIRPARELLGWSRERLEGETGVKAATLRLLEAGRTKPRGRTLAAIHSALEAAGVECTNGDQPGVRLKKAGP